MATSPRANPKRDELPSDSEEDDEDFVPRHNGDADATSSGSCSDDDNEAQRGKRAKLDRGGVSAPSATRADTDLLWAELNAETPSRKALGSGATSGDGAAHAPDGMMVKIVTEYKFANDIIREDKLVPSTSPEAIAYFKKHPELAPKSTAEVGAKSSREASNNKGKGEAGEGAIVGKQTAQGKTDHVEGSALATEGKPLISGRPGQEGPSSSNSSSASPSPSTSDAGAGAKRPRPGPRKPKTSLASRAAAASNKPVKLNTLEKSKMDWDKYASRAENAGLKEEMEAQRKSKTGFLEKKDFLERVEGRAGQFFDKSKQLGKRTG